MIGRVCCAALVGALIIGPTAVPAAATSFADGKAAYDKGQFERSQSILRPLAQAGDPHAQFLLGRQYQLGQGVEKNLVKAWLWYRRAEAKGHTEAALFRHLLEKRKLMTAGDLRQARLLYGDPIDKSKPLAKVAKPAIKAKPRSRPQFATKTPDKKTEKKPDLTAKKSLPDAKKKKQDMAALSKPSRRQLSHGQQPEYRPQSGAYSSHGDIGQHRPDALPQRPRFQPQRPAWSHDDWQARRWRERQRWRQYRRWRRMQRRRMHGYYGGYGPRRWRRWREPHGYYQY